MRAILAVSSAAMCAIAMPAFLDAAPSARVPTRQPSIDASPLERPRDGTLGCGKPKCVDEQRRPSRDEDDGGMLSWPDASAGDASLQSIAIGPHAAIAALMNTRGLACTGTLVGPKTILTARHCLPLVEARFGHDAQSPIATRRVVGARTPTTALDVALVELDERVSIEPLRLRGESEASAPNGTLRLVGYGALDPAGAIATSLRHVANVTVREWGCDEGNAGRLGCRPGFELVVPRGAGADTCVGDSGGPVLEQEGGQVRVVAVTSRAVSEALLQCGDGGVYTRADRVEQWVVSNVRSMEKKKK